LTGDLLDMKDTLLVPIGRSNLVGGIAGFSVFVWISQFLIFWFFANVSNWTKD
jgi:hypothetical protein